MREELLEVLEKEVLTEENTDMFIDVVLGFVKLPIWLRWFPLRSILDKALPGAVLAGVRAIVKKNEAQG